MATAENDATTTTAGDAGEGAGILDGGHAVPGEDLSTPNGTPAGPAPDEVEAEALEGAQVDDEAAATAPADEAAPAEAGREFATVQWQMPFWERPAGHLERVELTPIMRGAIAGGKLVVVGEVECVKAPCKTPRKRG